MEKKGLIKVKTMICPFCGKEIKEEAILCKYCHNLLIDENGNILPPQNSEAKEKAEEVYGEAEAETAAEEVQADAETDAAEEEPAAEADDEKTLVYSKDELKKALEEASAENISSEEVLEQAEENLDEYDEENDGEYDDIYIEDSDDETEVYTDGVSAENDGEEETEEYNPKRIFAITAIITVGILILIIAAVSVGYKLFGFGGDSSSVQTTSSEAPQTTTAAPDDDSFEEYVPQVTDDTVSEDPEEIADSTQEDPVTELDSSNTDSASDSALDSGVDSDTDSSSDSSSTDSINADDSPSFEPAGSYYSWNEALQLWENYKTNHGYNDESKYYTILSYCPDDYTMIFLCQELESGETNYYSLDLYTGEFTPVQ